VPQREAHGSTLWHGFFQNITEPPELPRVIRVSLAATTTLVRLDCAVSASGLEVPRARSLHD
jgi:hypothetical protein